MGQPNLQSAPSIENLQAQAHWARIEMWVGRGLSAAAAVVGVLALGHGLAEAAAAKAAESVAGAQDAAHLLVTGCVTLGASGFALLRAHGAEIALAKLESDVQTAQQNAQLPQSDASASQH